MKRTRPHIDQFLLCDPFDGTPADVGTDRPLVDPDAADAAAQNERATESAARDSAARTDSK